VELEWTREQLRFEHLAASGEEQIVVEGEAALPGSMRDAVTVLSVQAQPHVQDVQPGVDEAGVRGRIRFQVLYTQGDLTRVRSLETTCDFERRMRLPGVTPGMRLDVRAALQETEGTAISGRITLRALLQLTMDAVETVEHALITAAPESPDLRAKTQQAAWCMREAIGEERAVVREEQELAARLGVGDVLCATATASVGEMTGGSGRIGVTGVITVRVLHQPQTQGEHLVTTVHELPYDLVIAGQLPDGVQVRTQAEVTDVMADSVLSDKRRTLRMEAEVRVRLWLVRRQERALLADFYSLRGPVIQPKTQEFDVLSAQEEGEARESTRLQVTLPKDAPPVETVLAAFVQPVLTGASPAGRRLDAEGVMGVTLIYLPQDSDIPYAVHVREPFAMTFPLETGEGVRAQAYALECDAGTATSDRVELRCVLGLRTSRMVSTRLTGVCGVREEPEEEHEHGFILVWPASGETRWDTARRLRVAEEALRPAGKRALLAFRK